jgi:rubredoxin-NAD+ reductase
MTAYRRWQCFYCGLIYNEELGLPENGIAPGTRWEDIPEDWMCPDCGAGKHDLQLMDD